MEANRKTVDVRNGPLNNMKTGDIVVFYGWQWEARYRVTDLRRYPNLDALLAAEDLQQILPGANEQQARAAAAQMLNPNRPLIAIEFAPS